MCAEVLGEDTQPLAALHFDAGAASLWKRPQSAQQTQTEHRVLWAGEHHTTSAGKAISTGFYCKLDNWWFVLFHSVLLVKKSLKSKIQDLSELFKTAPPSGYFLFILLSHSWRCFRRPSSCSNSPFRLSFNISCHFCYTIGDSGLPSRALFSAPRGRHVGRPVAEKMQVSRDRHSHCLWAAWLLWTGEQVNWLHCPVNKP